MALLTLAGCAVLDSDGRSDDAAAPVVDSVAIDRNGDVAGAPPPESVPADPAGDGTAVCPPLSIAVAVPLAGPDAALGREIRNGVQLAVDRHNSAHGGCQIQLKPFDTEAVSDDAAASAARQVVDDAFTLGVVGPARSGAVSAMGSIFEAAGMVALSPSATAAALTERGWRTFFRGLADDVAQGVAVANYLRSTVGAGRVCVLGVAEDAERIQAVRETLGPAADPGCSVTVADSPEGRSDVVDRVVDSAPDAVFFGGDESRAATLVGQLRGAGYDAKFFTAQGVPGPGRTADPLGGDLTAAYTEQFDEAPGPFSAAGYDLGTVLLLGIDSGARTRPALQEFVRAYRGSGWQRTYQWTDEGELVDPLVWVNEFG
ncbi:branched-chain amino acid ABC transporter substrate-binding protein [Mycolicibacterium duvalii]|uniref:branched-chain amino acid ABC transporter substrate-binding protein n=1 Tax=Mycolicibacterium duvalii TaxID=39688 RepID=UPI001FCFCCC1|nr:branched-chain amino acid ABC transporter substrate-binding protein [Mycolicibacterium duvalii]